jgi:cytochrome c-type biogenesis protein CcmH
MVTFWIIGALLILLALWFILPALLNKPADDEEVERREANILIYKDQQRELDADFKNGLIGKEQFAKEKTELERRLLEDVSAASANTKTKYQTNRFVYGVAGFIPVGAVVLYLVIGNTKAITSPASLQTMPPAVANPAGTM